MKWKASISGAVCFTALATLVLLYLNSCRPALLWQGTLPHPGARQIALEHGGDLLILNPRGGKRGACLSLRLPLAPEKTAVCTTGVTA